MKDRFITKFSSLLEYTKELEKVTGESAFVVPYAEDYLNELRGADPMTSRGAAMSKWTPTEATNYFGDDNLFYEIRGHVDGYGDDETIALVDATPLDEDWRWKNAVLLASAPELVEALDNTSAALDSVLAHFKAQMPSQDYVQRNAVLRNAELVLSKAHGGK